MSDNQRLQNLYIARLTSQERPCFVCSKFTNVVLTLADNSNADWFYTCKSHLGDFNFCSKVGGTKTKSPELKKEVLVNRPVESDSVSDLVSSIGTAWKSWRGKDEKKPEDADKKEEKEEKKEEKAEKEQADLKKQDTPSPPAISSPVSPQLPVRFILQKDYFYLRQREYMKKLQSKQASEKLKTLQFPEVPKNKPIYTTPPTK
ncbi:hypothetical protein INT47_001214 [Mucor saturninus]|uniref:VPS4-associated protein 1 n=1 Tax=Mucor saturninus TaxID=64648 RepID=A0A8H7RNY5_9FUNG|nr:hypothetical protein INT47_001214 [Mucor saturninus]